MTWAPCMETTLPSASFLAASIPMPSVRAVAWMVAKSPVSPVNAGSWALSHAPRDSGVSRSGSVVTKTTWSLSWSALGSAFLATAMLLIVRGHTSGQLV